MLRTFPPSPSNRLDPCTELCSNSKFNYRQFVPAAAGEHTHMSISLDDIAFFIIQIYLRESVKRGAGNLLCKIRTGSNRKHMHKCGIFY